MPNISDDNAPLGGDASQRGLNGFLDEIEGDEEKTNLKEVIRAVNANIQFSAVVHAALLNEMDDVAAEEILEEARDVVEININSGEADRIHTAYLSMMRIMEFEGLLKEIFRNE